MPDAMGSADGTAPFREVVVDLGAIEKNVSVLRTRIGAPLTMAVVKANAYGHGAVEASRAALAGGADWLGVADVDEALQLREAGIEAPILAWLHDPGEDFRAAVAAGVDIGVSSLAQLDAAVRAADRGLASVQVKLETGLSRNGVSEPQWPEVFEAAARLQAAGRIRVRGLFTHLSGASPEDDRAALAVFERGLAAATATGIEAELVHAASTGAALDLPESRYDLVRLGIGVYGLSPFEDRSSAELGLTPAMTVRGRVAAVRRVPEGTGISYGYDYHTNGEATLALVPLGYAEGVPRNASNRAPVAIGGRWHTVSGRVAMDQFVVDVGDQHVAVGDEVVLFGDPATGVPAADDWARATGTINYEIVTRMGGRAIRTYRRLPREGSHFVA